ncbi:MAG: 4'-phosphopantetheinyl transferase superfamily protein [Flavobacteriales bacterium]|nr:MAG: 4'-phosphopantetheinyl transferase superfamily protein [Flavobacteriales bacterium]
MARKLVLHCRGIDAPPSGSPSNGITLHFATLEDLSQRQHELEALLDRHERDRAARFVHDKDRLRYVLGHGFMREVLSAASGVPATSIDFTRGPFGKPSMNGADFHFNFSDTKDAVLIGIGPEELGVDLETMERRVDHERVAEHYFTPEEVREMERASDKAQVSSAKVQEPSFKAQASNFKLQRAERAAKGEDAGKRRFLEFWTRKEAVLKASGVGIMDDLKVLRVQDGMHEIHIAHEEFIRMAAAQYHISTFALGTSHVISVASSIERPLALIPPRRTGDGN